VSERQVDQETVAIIQPAKDECRNKGMEDGRRRKVAKQRDAVCCTWVFIVRS